MTPLIPRAAHRVAIAVLVALLALPANSCSHMVKAADAQDPPTRAARLTSLDGDVSMEGTGSDTTWSQATPNDAVTTGDRLYTGQGAHAELDIGSISARMGDSTDLTVTNLTDNFAQLGVGSGTLVTTVHQWIPADSVEIDTPNGALMAEAAGTYRVTADPSQDFTDVAVDSGSLQLTGPGLNQTLSAGQDVRLSGTNPIQVADIAAPTTAAVDQWSRSRDALYRPSAPAAQYVNPSTPGWEDLDQNGSWASESDDGEVWFPSNVSADWAPYQDGHWAWVDPWGWTWVDNDSWGFAPFHYGRWARFNRGWGWLPGPAADAPVYAPALVSFVDGASLGVSLSLAAGSAGLEAWFPLGPREPYFPWYHHDDNYLRAVNSTNLVNAGNIDPLIHPRDVNALHWANRATALTAVPDPVMRQGDPVARGMVRVDPTQVARAQLAPHPGVNPDPIAVAGGPPAPRPPALARPVMVAHGGPGNSARVAHAGPANPGNAARVANQPNAGAASRPSGGGAPRNAGPVAGAPALITRNAPPAGNGAARSPRAGAAERSPPGEVAIPRNGAEPRAAMSAPAVAPVPARVAPRSAPGAAPGAVAAPRAGEAPRAPRPIMTRNAPPQARPSFQAQQPALAAHPGRPLEPQQVQNIRGGHPAGPPRDVEVPAHVRAPAAAPAPRAQPTPAVVAPRAQPAPAPQHPPAAPPRPPGHKPPGPEARP